MLAWIAGADDSIIHATLYWPWAAEYKEGKAENMEREGQEMGLTLKVIARIRSDFPDKFGIPRQSGRIPSLKGEIIFEPEYRNPDAFRGIEEFSHIWLIWEFSRAVREDWSPTVRPPRLGGNVRKGVFATRSPFRPNALGLSSVKLEGLELHPELGPVLHVAGADLMDGTPIYDIKPYLPYTDSHPEAAGGFTDVTEDPRLQVVFPEEWKKLVPRDCLEALIAVLEEDPRPRYHKDQDRIYGLAFRRMDVRFQVKDGILTVCGITEHGR